MEIANSGTVKVLLLTLFIVHTHCISALLTFMCCLFKTDSLQYWLLHAWVFEKLSFTPAFAKG
jgi:hypothetical protein